MISQTPVHSTLHCNSGRMSASAVIIGMSYFAHSHLTESQNHSEDRETSRKAMRWLVGVGLFVGACCGIYFTASYLGKQEPVMVHIRFEYDLTADFATQTRLNIHTEATASELTKYFQHRQIYDCCFNQEHKEWNDKNVLMVQTGPINKALPRLTVDKCLERRCLDEHLSIKYSNHYVMLGAKEYKGDGCVEQKAGHADKDHFDVSVRWWGETTTTNVACPRLRRASALYKWMLDKNRVSGYAKWNTYIASTNSVIKTDVTIYQPETCNQIGEEDGLSSIDRSMEHLDMYMGY